jgi:metal-responsive CopG/Arc/MetJ family transcriptional regulator
MARHKISEEEKKKDLTVTIDIKLNEKLEKYLTEKNINNKSKYIENLIKNDLINRGENIKNEF